MIKIDSAKMRWIRSVSSEVDGLRRKPVGGANIHNFMNLVCNVQAWLELAEIKDVTVEMENKVHNAIKEMRKMTK